MHNEKREKYLGGGGMQRPPEVVPFGIKAEGRQHRSRFHEARQHNDCHGKNERSVEQNPPDRARRAPACQKATGKIDMLGAVHEEDHPNAKSQPFVSSFANQRIGHEHREKQDHEEIHTNFDMFFPIHYDPHAQVLG